MDEEFLQQWAGTGYSYPLTYNQIANKIKTSRHFFGDCKLYKITQEEEIAGYKDAHAARMIGTVELNTARMPWRSAMVCRFLIDPTHRGKGYGTDALIALTQMAFRQGFILLRLKVFAFNEPAIRCYGKAGFTPCGAGTWSNGQSVIEMQIRKN
jgi:RimJ/RimL family protein N-acetyltransferase